jgi:replicative DNA helicase
MIDQEAYPEVESILTSEMFYDKANNCVFSAIKTLSDRKRPVDMLTVLEALKQSGELEEAGGPYYLSQLTAGVTGGGHVAFHARVIAQKYLARQIISLANEIQRRAFDQTEDVEDILESLESKLTEISMQKAVGESIRMDKAVPEAIRRASKAQEDRKMGVTTAIPTGIGKLTSEFYGGWKSPDLIVLAARPSIGKSQLALHFAQSAARADKHVLFVSIEMSSTQLVNRLLLEEEGIIPYNLSTGQMKPAEWDALNRRAAEIWNLKIHIADQPATRYLDAICSEARRLNRKGELDMLIIDYLGLILIRNQKFERRQLEIARITGTLKNLAKELDIPVMLLSQLNRPERGVAVREPQLHDLRESGDIEQDADIVLFIHRPEYYDNENQEWRGKGKIIIGKYREGARNRHVIFHHDTNFKKIWGNDEIPLRASDNGIHPDAHLEPQHNEKPF